MNKRGAIGVLWLYVFYVILAIVIVFAVYQFANAKVTETIDVGYASRQVSLDVDTSLASYGGNIEIKETFQKPLLFNINKKEVTVINPNTTTEVDYHFFPDLTYGEIESSNKKAVSEIKIINDEGVEIFYG